MLGDGLWLSRKQRRSFHQPRLRRESYGELVQIDGSDHRWFEDRGEPCTLLVFIDDATSKRMGAKKLRPSLYLQYPYLEDIPKEWSVASVQYEGPAYCPNHCSMHGTTRCCFARS
jgi:hypothetical protein